MAPSSQGHDQESITLVAPNGQTQEERYDPNEKVGHVLKKAVDDFGRAGYLNPSLQYVLVMGGTPLNEGQTLAEAGVRPGARLSVRAKDIPGDGAAPRPE